MSHHVDGQVDKKRVTGGVNARSSVGSQSQQHADAEDKDSYILPLEKIVGSVGAAALVDVVGLLDGCVGACEEEWSEDGDAEVMCIEEAMCIQVEPCGCNGDDDDGNDGNSPGSAGGGLGVVFPEWSTDLLQQCGPTQPPTRVAPAAVWQQGERRSSVTIPSNAA